MLFIVIIGGINDISFATGYILMVLAILSLSTISYDEANHGLNTLFTLNSYSMLILSISISDLNIS